MASVSHNPNHLGVLLIVGEQRAQRRLCSPRDPSTSRRYSTALWRDRAPLGSGKAPADYVLNVDGRPFILIEAKGLRTELDEKQARQVLSSAAVETVRWCALTRG